MEVPEDIRAIAASMATEIAAEGTFVGLQKKVAAALFAERERCAQIIEHRPLAIPDRQELAAYIRSGWISLHAPTP